jgi:hypothetical protein
MAKKSKKAPPRKAVVKRKSKAKTVKPSRGKSAARKKIVKRRPAKKRETTIEKIENAILVGAAEIDNVAVGLGLLAASPPPPKTRQKKR